jgi:excisionase family DNA binding protein
MITKSANLLTVKETAEYLRIPVPTVYYLVQRGELPAIQIGGRWRIKKDLLDQDVLKVEGGAAGADAKSSQGRDAKILVVDDQQDIQNILVLALSNKGLNAEVASSGQEALEKIKSNDYNIMFLDLHLPDISGDEVFEKAFQMRPNLHIVIMTGYSTVDNLEKILAFGPVTVLQKPFKLEQLIRITDVLLGKR